MSDFIYTSTIRSRGKLSEYLQAVYHRNPPTTHEYHGSWGSLAVSRNLYNGFQPLETDEQIVVVIGGPVLQFCDNLFLVSTKDPQAGTRAIQQRCQAGQMNWEKDLSGPFVVLLIEKKNRQITFITDLMMFIPVYQFQLGKKLVLATHIESAAQASGQQEQLDTTSIVDFILHGVVTHPYTVYQNIRQVQPAAIHTFRHSNSELQAAEPTAYWGPKENNPYSDIKQAAEELRQVLAGYVKKVTENMSEVAQFLSAGEDSRAVAGMLPQQLKRDGFIFLDSMNREGKLAQKAANAYNVNFKPVFRPPANYLDILPEAADLIGFGHQYCHAHSLRLHQNCELSRYPAVFGGYLADSLLKAEYALKNRSNQIFPFLPQFYKTGEVRSLPTENAIFSQSILQNLDQRRLQHLQKIRDLRPRSQHEWFALWPATMRATMPNLYCNRRFFRIYEPFMSNQVIKIAAAVPVEWKFNRRLFNQSMRPFLRSSRWIFHPTGRLPYYSWQVNCLLHFIASCGRRLKSIAGFNINNQGAWTDWRLLMQNEKWQKAINENKQGVSMLSDAILADQPDVLLQIHDKNFNRLQKVNLLQVLYHLRCRQQ